MSLPKHQIAIKVLSPADLDRFACTGCGGCCRSWGVEIDESSFKRAKTFLENPPEPRPNPDILWYFEERGKKYYQLTKKETCVFLDADNKCYLHKHDPMLKSVICRDFPRGGTMTPRAYELHMSFSSFGAFVNVLCNPEPFRVVEMEVPPVMNGIEITPHPIRHPHPYGWETYFLIEGILLDFIGRVDSLDDALAASARFLSTVEREPDGKHLRRKLRSRELHPVQFLESKPLTNLEGSYRLMHDILLFRKVFLQRSSPLTKAVEDLQTLLRELEQGPDEEKIGPALFYRRLRRLHYDPSRSQIEPVIRKFMQYKIFQKAFFCEYGWVLGFNILSFLYAILRLRLMVRSRRTSSQHAPSIHDLFDPIHFVELHFSHSGKFLQFWQEVIQSNLMSSSSISEILIRV